MFERYAIYVTAQGSLARIGAAWLGWDIATGMPVTHPVVGSLDIATLTEKPRKYGFHGTIKPPFYLRDERTLTQLEDAFAGFCATAAPVDVAGLRVQRLGGFLALVPVGDVAALSNLAAQVVTQFDHFRVPPGDQELARRRRSNLNPAQEKNLCDWGCPHVLDQFRFHMTLTGRLKKPEDVKEILTPYFAPHLPHPFRIEALSLVGQAADGMFCEIARAPLLGDTPARDQAESCR